MLTLKLKCLADSVFVFESPSTTEDFRNVICAETVCQIASCLLYIMQMKLLNRSSKPSVYAFKSQPFPYRKYKLFYK